jgi:hypothetical protein
MSVSDIVVLRGGDRNAAAYYVDKFGFTEVPEFLQAEQDRAAEQAVYKYYSTQRPVDIGTFPKTPNAPTQIVNFDKREAVENGLFQAWGYLEYSAPLAQKQIDDYELKPAHGNPDIRRRMDEQAQTVGAWEEKRKIPETQRLTWWYLDFGSFVPKEFVTPSQLAERYDLAVRAQTRAEKKPPRIADQLAEAEKQVQRGEKPSTEKSFRNSEDRT